MTDLNEKIGENETINDIIHKANILVEALPYIRELRGKTVVI